MDLDNLLRITQNGLKLFIFDSRYSDGLVVLLTSDASHAAHIEDLFLGGDSDWESVSFALHDLKWFPLVFVDKISEAIPKLQEKLNAIGKEYPNKNRWFESLNLIGHVIEKNKHRHILSIEKYQELNDLNIAVDVFYKLLEW